MQNRQIKGGKMGWGYFNFSAMSKFNDLKIYQFEIVFCWQKGQNYSKNPL